MCISFLYFETLLGKRLGCGLAKVNVTEWKIWKIGWYTLKTGESQQSMDEGEAQTLGANPLAVPPPKSDYTGAIH